MNALSQYQSELRRIRQGPVVSEKPGGVGTMRFIVRCPTGSDLVLTNAKAVLSALDLGARALWPSVREWQVLLPEWFVERCPPAMSEEEVRRWMERWRAASAEQKVLIELDRSWDLEDWLYSMMPEQRQWFWWDAKSVADIDHIMVAVEVLAHPFPWGNLRWLFLAAGASAVEAE